MLVKQACASAICVLLLGACENPGAVSAVDTTPSETARWIGEFRGVWDGMCDRQAPGSFTISDITGGGRAEWTWNCGTHESIRRSFEVEGDVLVINLRGRREARYRFIDDDTVEGTFIAPDIPAMYRGTFTKVAN